MKAFGYLIHRNNDLHQPSGYFTYQSNVGQSSVPVLIRCVELLAAVDLCLIKLLSAFAAAFISSC